MSYRFPLGANNTGTASFTAVVNHKDFTYAQFVSDLCKYTLHATLLYITSYVYSQSVSYCIYQGYTCIKQPSIFAFENFHTMHTMH